MATRSGEVATMDGGALRHLNLGMPESSPASPNRSLPDCCFLEAGIVELALPPDFGRIGAAACASCQMLQTFFPRVRTPCGHGAQVIVEGREEQSDGGEKNKDNKTTQNQTNHSPQAESPPSCSLSSVLGETSETKTNDYQGA